MKIEKVLYRGLGKAVGGPEAKVSTPDGNVSVKLSTPKELGGNGAVGTNAQQLFALGYSSCFISAMKFVAAQDNLKLPENIAVDGTVGIGQIPGGFGMEVELKINVPGMDKAQVRALVDKANRVCPYSNATRGNIEVALAIV